MTIVCQRCGATLQAPEASGHASISCLRCGQPNAAQAIGAARGRGSSRVIPLVGGIVALAGIGAVVLLTAGGIVAYLVLARDEPSAPAAAPESESTGSPLAPSEPYDEVARPEPYWGPGWSDDARKGIHPSLPSCEAAQVDYVKAPGFDAGPGLTAGASRTVLNNARYLAACALPGSMAVQVCVAAQAGKAVGVSVYSRPDDRAKRQCIAEQVARLSFPSGPGMDLSRANFGASE